MLAMRGPRRLAGGRAYEDTPGGARDFSPAYYADILKQYDVVAVVRLNEAQYDAADLAAEGLALADLPFDDCAAPPAAVVAKFLAIAEGVPGALAVHCKAGLGRTGTLIALYMMKHHGFTARQAMGWLCIVGSIIGPQQQYLCESEEAIRTNYGSGSGQFFRLISAPLFWMHASLCTFLFGFCSGGGTAYRITEISLNKHHGNPKADSYKVTNSSTFCFVGSKGATHKYIRTNSEGDEEIVSVLRETVDFNYELFASRDRKKGLCDFS